MIRNQQKNQHMGFSFKLKSYLSTNSFSPDENHLKIQDKNIPSSKDEKIFSDKSFLSNESSSIDYPKIYEQNKRRLKQVQNNSDLRQAFFDQNYIKTQLIDTRYFYSDILIISRYIIYYLTVNVKSQGQIAIQNPLISLKNIHFLLKVYHMYIKQFKHIKEQTYFIIEYFFDHSLIFQNFHIQNSLEPFIYLKKYIESQILLGNSNKIVKLTQKYSIFLQKAYKHEAMNLSKQLNPDLSNDMKFSAKIFKKSKLLEKYLLSYPNLWIQTFSADTSNEGQNLSGPALKAYDYFVTQFSNLFKQAVDYWLNFDSQIKLPSPMPVNFSCKKFLIEQFKQEDLNKCLNCLRLIIHRLWSILEIPRLINQRSHELAIKKQDQKISELSFKKLAKNYEEGNLNILKYLPSGKIAQGEYLKFMRLLILMKKLFGYHTLRRVREKDMTNHLEKLFENNWSDIIVTKNEDKKRQINILIGQLISRLVSGSWTDEQDVLGKYFQNNLVTSCQKKGMRENREEFLK